MKYELSHDSIAHQVFEKAASELKAGRRAKDLVTRQLERHSENPAILLSKEDLEEIQPFIAVVAFSEQEEKFIRKSKAKIRLRKRIMAGVAIGAIVFLTALSIWALSERSKSRMQQRRSAALALAGKALEHQISNDYTMSLKCAVYAVEIDENDETRRALLKSVYNSPGIYYFQKLNNAGDNAVFSPVAPYPLLSWSYTGREARLWKPDFSEFIPLEGHQDAILDAAFSTDGKWIATAGLDSIFILWNGDGSPTGKKIRTGHPIKSVKFNPLNQYWYTMSLEGDLVRYDTEGKRIDTLVRSGFGPNFDMSPDGKYLTLTASDTVKILDADGNPILVLKESEYPDNFKFQPFISPDPGCYRIIAQYSSLQRVSIYDFCPGLPDPSLTLNNSFSLPDEDVIDANIDLQGRLILLGSKGTVRIFTGNWLDPESEDYSTTDFNAGSTDKYHLLLHPEKLEPGITGLNLDIHLWDLDPENRIYQTLFKRKRINGDFSVLYQVFPEAGMRIEIYPAAGDPDSLILQDIDSGKPIMRSVYEPDNNPVWNFSPSGRHFAVRFQENADKLYLYTREGNLVKTLGSAGQPILDYRFSPDGNTLAWVAGRHVRFLNAETLEFLPEVSLEDEYERLGYSGANPDEMLLVSKPDETDAQHILKVNLKNGSRSRTEAPKSILPVWGFLPVPNASDWILLNHAEAMLYNDQSSGFRSIKESGNNGIYHMNASPDGKWYLIMSNYGLTITRKEDPNKPYLQAPGIASANFSFDMQWLYLQTLEGELQKWPWSTTAIFDRVKKMKLADLEPHEKTLYLSH